MNQKLALYKSSYQANGKTVNVTITSDSEPSKAALRNYAQIVKRILREDDIKEEA